MAVRETIKQSELRNNNSGIMRRVAAGESFTVTVHGRPRQAGRNPRPRRINLLIAAIAVRHGFFLATRNGADLRHLERVLTVIDVN